MISDSERRDVAHMLREVRYDTIDAIFPSIGLSWKHGWLDFWRRIADYVEQPYPDATASYKGWRAEVYDPDGVLASPSNVAADLVRAHADGKGPGIDRDALLKLAGRMENMAGMGALLTPDGLEMAAASIREAIGEGKE